MYQDQWWSNHRTLHQTKILLKESDMLIGIIDKTGQLLGFLRVLTDFLDIAVIYDVIVHKDYQKRGLGRILMKAVTEDPKLDSIRYLDLFCKPEMNGFYQEFGFELPKTGTNMLRLGRDEKLME